MTSKNNPGTRERLVAAMSQSLQERGYHGVGLSEILQQAEAPKGVLYHHFPGGKTDLAVEALRTSIANVKARLHQLLQIAQGDPVQAIRIWFETARKSMDDSRYERGCPLATVALESTAADVELRNTIAQGFSEIREILRHMLLQASIPEAKAETLATVIIAGYEGALIQTRVASSPKPLLDTCEMLVLMIQSRQSQPV